MPRSNRNRPTASICVWSASGTSMIGSPERFGVAAPISARASRTRFVMRYRSARSRSPFRSFTSNPASMEASDATGDGPE